MLYSSITKKHYFVKWHLFIVCLLLAGCAGLSNVVSSAQPNDSGWEAAPESARVNMPTAKNDSRFNRAIDSNNNLSQEQLNSLLQSADQAYQTQQWNLAGKLYQDAIAANNTDIHSLFRLGNIAILNRDLDAAQDYYARVLQINPNNSKAQYNLATVHLTKAEEHFQFYTATLNDEAVEPKLLSLMREIDRFSNLQPVEKSDQSPLDSLRQLLDSN